MNRILAKKLIGGSLLVLFSLQIQGCLKTRAQLRNESGPEVRSDFRGEGGEERSSARAPSSAPAVQDVKPQVNYLVEEMKDELTRLSGRVEDLERQQRENEKSSNQEQAKETFHALEVRVSQLEKDQQSIQESARQAQEEALVRQDPADLLKETRTLFKEGKYQEVLDQLAKLQRLPKFKGLEDVFFLKGESLFHLKQYKKAVVEFSRFPEKFTHSPHLPEALFKIGLSFDAMGMKEDAKGFYQDLVEKFPRSTQAKTARKKIK